MTLGTQAAQEALHAAGCGPEEIDAIVDATLPRQLEQRIHIHVRFANHSQAPAIPQVLRQCSKGLEQQVQPLVRLDLAELEEDQTVSTGASCRRRDLVTAVLIVSLLINVAVLIAWIAIKVTTSYDAEVAAFLFNR